MDFGAESEHAVISAVTDADADLFPLSLMKRMSSRPVSGKACCGNAAGLAQVNAIYQASDKEKTRSLRFYS